MKAHDPNSFPPSWGGVVIVGGYDLHLYCRNERPDFWGMDYDTVPMGHHRGGVNAAMFVGPTLADCRKQSKEAGWTWQRDGDVTCPLCNRKPTPSGGQ